MDQSTNKICILSGRGSKRFADRISRQIESSNVIDTEVSTFSDGEINIFINGNVRGQDVFIVQSFYTAYRSSYQTGFEVERSVNDHLVELLLIVDACKRASAKSITAVIPYFGYARQDRKIKRAPISGKLVADMLTAAGVSRVLTMDLHSDQIQGFFNCPVDNLYSSILAARYIERTLTDSQKEKLTIVSPDVGGANRARRFKSAFEQLLGRNIGLAMVEKIRSVPNEIESMKVIGDVSGKTLIIIDDIIDTGGTLCKAADVLYESGANDIFAYCTHPVMSDKWDNGMKTIVGKIDVSKISKLFVSNTIPLRDDQAKFSKIEVINQDLVFSIAINRIFNNNSISTIFNNPELILSQGE